MHRLADLESYCSVLIMLTLCFVSGYLWFSARTKPDKVQFREISCVHHKTSCRKVHGNLRIRIYVHHWMHAQKDSGFHIRQMMKG